VPKLAVDGFEMTSGRVTLNKQVRKLRERQDSLDDHSSDSSDEQVFVAKKRGRKGQ
jgi:hypothetical protein